MFGKPQRERKDEVREWTKKYWRAKRVSMSAGRLLSDVYMQAVASLKIIPAEGAVPSSLMHGLHLAPLRSLGVWVPHVMPSARPSFSPPADHTLLRPIFSHPNGIAERRARTGCCTGR